MSLFADHAEVYRPPFKGIYTLFPDNALAVDVSSTDQTFTPGATIFCGGAGNVVVTPLAGGSDVTFTVVAGQVVPVRVSAVKKTGTTATSMVAVW